MAVIVGSDDGESGQRVRNDDLGEAEALVRLFHNGHSRSGLGRLTQIQVPVGRGPANRDETRARFDEA